MQQSKISALVSKLLHHSRRSPLNSNCFGLQRGPQLCYSTVSYEEFEEVHSDGPNDDEELIPNKREIQPQGVDPKKGWSFRGVHRAIICGKLGQAPVQKILRKGRTITIFTVGTGGMFDQRSIRSENMPRPVQWHRIVVHNEALGAYAVQKLMKDSPVFVEGDIETRVYNDSINGLVKNVPEICIRRDAIRGKYLRVTAEQLEALRGKVRLIRTSEGISSASLDDLREGLF